MTTADTDTRTFDQIIADANERARRAERRDRRILRLLIACTVAYVASSAAWFAIEHRELAVSEPTTFYTGLVIALGLPVAVYTSLWWADRRRRDRVTRQAVADQLRPGRNGSRPTTTDKETDRA